MGGGVLPVSIHKGQPVFLFSREAASRGYRDSGKWSDFGGSKENEETQLETAIRECAEEAAGLLGTSSDVERLIDKQSVAEINVNYYTTYVVYVPFYEEFPEEFRRVYDTACIKTPELVSASNGLYEKDDARWISLSELKTPQVREIFRPWYIRSGIVGRLVKHDWSDLRRRHRAYSRSQRTH